MRVIIVDDEINAINYLAHHLKAYEWIEIDKVFEDACTGFAYLLKNPCDLLFLDIEMPNISGIYMAEQLSNLYPEMRICFVTAYDTFAIKAFELSAIDYILKPYTPERLSQCLKRMEEKRVDTQMLTTLSESSEYHLDMICAYQDENIVLLSKDDILYMEVIQSSVWIHTLHKVYKGNKPLNFYEEKLKRHAFFRTHKCYLANLTKVAQFKPRINYTYDMYFKESSDVIPVSRNKVRTLKAFFEV